MRGTPPTSSPSRPSPACSATGKRSTSELEAHSKGWPLDRVAPLERSILRLALWEIRDEVSPPEVAIDEAVRLAKRYSTDDAGSFVNGVLGGIVRGDAIG